nr:T9SS type A sorting domain-containing protein [Bacteroidales bacterium]
NDIELINAYCEQQNSCNVVTVLFKMPGDKDYSIKLYNIYGQLIAKTSGISKDGYNQAQIYLNDILDQAIYIVILLNNEKIKTKKVLLY